MNEQTNALSTIANRRPEARCPLPGWVVRATLSGLLALVTLLPAASLRADQPSGAPAPGIKPTLPVFVLIEAKAKGPPEVQVIGAPHGWEYCTDTCAGDFGYITPGTDLGGIVSLFGVDVNGSINEPDECDWRFLDPTITQPTCKSADAIVWIQHDYSYYGPFFDGELQVAFNIHVPGGYYSNPEVCPAGCSNGVEPLTYDWQLVFADPTVVVLFRAERPR